MSFHTYKDCSAASLKCMQSLPSGKLVEGFLAKELSDHSHCHADIPLMLCPAIPSLQMLPDLHSASEISETTQTETSSISFATLALVALATIASTVSGLLSAARSLQCMFLQFQLTACAQADRRLNEVTAVFMPTSQMIKKFLGQFK